MTTPRTRSYVVASLVLFALSSLALVAPAADAATERTQPPTSHELAQRMLALVNRSRASHGLTTLHLNHRMSTEALRHSRQMAREDAIAHTSNLADLVRSVGGSVFGEDLGKGRGLRGIRNAWMRRADTRRIMLDPRFAHVGLGVVHIDGFYWVTLQVFN